MTEDTVTYFNSLSPEEQVEFADVNGLPWVLAGGLTPANVADAIRATGAPAVDVSSGVERAPGLKDPDLIRAFVARVKQTDREAAP